jgi:hypothetical protein
MKYSLEIATNNINGVQPGLYSALSKGITPIIRIGIGQDSGGFDIASTYVAFLDQVNTYVNTLIAAGEIPSDSVVYAIAGPNEPDIEYWIAPNCATSDEGKGDPRQAGFPDPLMYPCDNTTNDEFHPLRPYPASPCDPLIPEKPSTPSNPHLPTNPLTFSCGTSINVGGSIQFPRVNRNNLGSLPVFPETNPQSAEPGTLYRCSGSATETNVCTVERATFEITLNLSNAQIPILGNTQTGLDDATKTNNYLSWYLNGSIQQSDQKEINPNSPTDIDRLINYSGPIKKLLPYNMTALTQTHVNFGTAIYDTTSNSGLNMLHRYLINPPTRLDAFNPGPEVWQELLENIPLSSLEDITGEVTVSLISNQQPGQNGEAIPRSLPEGNYVIDETNPLNPAAITLNIKRDTDSRIYFPHLRTINHLSETLASLSRPKNLGFLDVGNPEIPRQKINDHQGLNSQYNATNDPPVRILYEYPGKPFVKTRNTEVIEPLPNEQPIPAPPPAFTDFTNWHNTQDGKPQDQRCTISSARLTQNNLGDVLYGRQINATLGYTQVFKYESYDPGTQMCDDDSAQCSPTGGNGAQGSCCGGLTCTLQQNMPCDPSIPAGQAGSCPHPWEGQYRCVGGGQGPFLPTQGRVAVFIKTPLVDGIYNTLVSGKNSVMRRFLPRKPEDYPTQFDYLAGEVRDDGSQDLTSTRYASTQVSLSTFGQATRSITGTIATAGDNSEPASLYFPRLGSLADYFLGATTLEQKNLQKLLRPKGFSSGSAILPSGGSCNATSLPPLPPIDPSCNNSPSGANDVACQINFSYNSPLLQQIFESAAAAYNVPVSVLVGIMYNEGGFNSQWTDARVLASAGPGCIDSTTCANISSSGAQGPWQFLSGTWDSSDAYGRRIGNASIDAGVTDRTTTNRCNIVDATFAAAKVLSIGRSGTNYPYDTCAATTLNTGIGASTSCNWTNRDIVTASRQYLGYCELEETCGYCAVRAGCTLNNSTTPPSQGPRCYQRRTLNIATCTAGLSF